MAEHRAADINGEEDEEEALRIAIALSLGKDPNSTSIDLTQDDEPAPPPAPALAPQPVTTAAPSSSLSALGLDRKKMEEERLARQNKRKASELGSGTVAEAARPQQRQKTNDNAPRTLSTVVPSPAPMAASLPFPQGVVKKTWVYGQPRLGDDIKIEEVLQKDKLELAVLSSFQWDNEWLMSKIDFKRTKITYVAFAANEAQREEMRSSVPPSRIRFCFPPMLAQGSMHSKLQLLKYANYLRIAIPTGNLVPYDWGETGVMENMVFIIDLPRFENLEQQREAQALKLTPFAEDLFYFLAAQGLDDSLVSTLQKYDFSETKRYAFVHSMAGSHSGESWKRTGESAFDRLRGMKLTVQHPGYCGLGRAVSALGLASEGDIELDYVCASLGAVNYDLLRGLYFASQGDSGLKEYQLRTTTRKGKTVSGGYDDVETLNKHIRVYFPSLQTVKESRGGKNNAGTICFQSKWWAAESFPHQVLRDCQSTRKGVIMHSKVMFVRQSGSRTGQSKGFAYVGSANLSESAWGRLVKERGTGSPKITCRNWECGVLVEALPQPDIDLGGNSSEIHDDLSSFAGRLRVPLPMKLPPQALGRDRTPWFYMDG
ncbi:tyrosyl-DNA phosphodiesterase-domain-containing protein [Cercophora newfieldiana]|uniref:Tyrosyl-DNA phosphodiesterase-domain-containing protein n=1 Tax=Cercophora newfieldiana TaxID=92897 RepID=A0AA39Y7C3_9PEZI|nr:tyrosyl-DNA phosphodiesterase-domain-containing protein [Cercophora newfieldiana]